MTDQNKLDYIGIDRFRLAAAILVIAIHTSPFLSFSKTGDIVLAGILARVAVPFFFMATGFFLLRGQDVNAFSYQRFFFKNLRLYAAAILLFLPLSIYAGYFNQNPFLPELIKDLVFNGTFYHLWYFPAIILGTGIVLLLMRRLPFKTALAVSVVLYLAGLFGDSYYGISSRISFLKGVYDILFQCFDYTRNGLFFAPLYLMMGIFLAKRDPLSLRKCTLGLSISLGLMLTEGLLLHLYSRPRHDSMYVSLIFCMYFLFQLLLHYRGASGKQLRRVSLLIYLIHPWCIVLIRGFAKAVRLQDILVHNSLVFFLAVAALSVTVSYSAGCLWALLLERKPPMVTNSLPSQDSLPLQNFLTPSGSLSSENSLQPIGLPNSPTRENSMLGQTSRAWAEINLSALRCNLAQLTRLLPDGCEVMAVVKADAYGHGAVPVAAALEEAGVQAFAVATLEEGIQLRKSGISGSILILGYTHPQLASDLIKYQLIQTAVDVGHAAALNMAAGEIEHTSRSESKIRIHLKLDTGMHRLGEPYDHVDALSKTFHMDHLIIEGMFTHLCVSDSTLSGDIAYTNQQIAHFYQTADSLESLGYRIPTLHIQSSYGILNYPRLHCSFARIGIALYGALSQEDRPLKSMAVLRPVMTIKARVASIRDLAQGSEIGYGRQFRAGAPIKTAVVTIGYGDGIPRNLKGGSVLINGKAASIIGRICMDQLIVDVSEIPEVQQGQAATILGRDGNLEITPEQLAEEAGTISNEFFSRLGGRLQRVYIRE